jgi:hypothetical protein
MPTSPYAHLYTLVTFLDTVRPASVLDIGLGNGKLGFIARDYLDVMIGERYHKSQWQLQLDGIEVFGDYIQEHQRAIYNDIFIGDAFDVIDGLGRYDMILMGDVLEHFGKHKGMAFLDKCFRHTHSTIALFIPLGDGWTQGAIYGNPHEAHQSAWQTDEILPLSSQHQLFEYGPGQYGAFLIHKEHYIDQRIEALKNDACCNGNHGRLNGIRSKFALDKGPIAAIDLRPLSRHAACAQYRGFFLDTDFKEHYQLLAYLSTRFNDATFFDIGTLKGYSALAMSFNRSNHVISYDIADFKELLHPEQLANIEYRIGNALDAPELLSASMILLDTAHDGLFENQVYAFLKKNGFKGLLVLDDIHLNDPMKHFWRSIDMPKEDLTDIGHWSGTGIVDFGQAMPEAIPSKRQGA